MANFREGIMRELMRVLRKDAVEKDGASAAEHAALGAGQDLDMSQEARMARAKEQGFDTSAPLYHGTDQDISSFQPHDGWYGSGVYVSRSPTAASHYARRTPDQLRGGSGEPAPNVMPLFARGNLAPYDEFKALNDKMAGPLEMTNSRVQDELQRRGYSGVDAGGHDQEAVVFDPKNVRSRFAAFDPAKRDSKDLLASALLGTGLGATAYGLGGQDQADAGVINAGQTSDDIYRRQSAHDDAVYARDRNLNALPEGFSSGEQAPPQWTPEAVRAAANWLNGPRDSAIPQLHAPADRLGAALDASAIPAELIAGQAQDAAQHPGDAAFDLIDPSLGLGRAASAKDPFPSLLINHTSQQDQPTFQNDLAKLTALLSSILGTGQIRPTGAQPKPQPLGR